MLQLLKDCQPTGSGLLTCTVPSAALFPCLCSAAQQASQRTPLLSDSSGALCSPCWSCQSTGPVPGVIEAAACLVAEQGRHRRHKLSAQACGRLMLTRRACLELIQTCSACSIAGGCGSLANASSSVCAWSVVGVLNSNGFSNSLSLCGNCGLVGCCLAGFVRNFCCWSGWRHHGQPCCLYLPCGPCRPRCWATMWPGRGQGLPKLAHGRTPTVCVAGFVAWLRGFDSTLVCSMRANGLSSCMQFI